MKKLLLCALFATLAGPVLIPRPANAYTRGDLITEIRTEVSDTNTDTAIQTFSDTLLHSRIDQAEDDINKLTRCLVSRSTVATTCGTREYEMPSGIMLVNRVTYDTSASSLTTRYTELSYNTIDGLDGKYPGWEYNVTSGTPAQYYYRGKYIGLQPPPGLLYSGDYGHLRLDYIIQPTTSTSASTVIFEGYNHLQTFKTAIIDYVLALCARDEDDATMMNFYWNKYNADITNMIERLNNRPDRLGGMTR